MILTRIPNRLIVLGNLAVENRFSGQNLRMVPYDQKIAVCHSLIWTLCGKCPVDSHFEFETESELVQFKLTYPEYELVVLET